MTKLNTTNQMVREFERVLGPARNDDRFTLSPRAALYVAFLEAGNTSDDATVLAEYSMAHPATLLEDCKPSTARAWASNR
jgi:hypothetical protein